MKRGDVVRKKGEDREEVVRSVSVALQLADGTTEVYDALSESVAVIPQESPVDPAKVAKLDKDEAE